MPAARVYFVPLKPDSTEAERLAALDRLLAAAADCAVFAAGERVAVKTHVGERMNDTHVKPALIKKVVDWVKRPGARPFLTETSTLYKGERSDGLAHLEQAFRHGFTYENTGAPFLMADGLLGNTEIEVAIPGRLSESVRIAREAVVADGLVAISHPTGHMQTGLGACLKNLGMGLASRIGKLRQHSSVKPFVTSSACTLCRACIKWCPEEAIIERDGAAFIITENCTGCGECLAVCNVDAVEYNWSVESGELQKSVAEHALGAVIGKPGKCVYLNVLTDMTGDCDCLAKKQPKIMGDIGLCLSLDPVAVDQATLDLTKGADKKDLGRRSYPRIDPTIQLAHAETIGLGTREYTLVKI
jgi:uncharacterized protein